MIIVSSRKFRDNQNSYFEKATSEDVILQTLRYGSFRLVPIREDDTVFADVKKAEDKKKAAMAANFHTGGKRVLPAESTPQKTTEQVIDKEDIEEMVRTAVQEAVAAAVPAAAAAAVQARQTSRDVKANRQQRSASKVKFEAPRLFQEPTLPLGTETVEPEEHTQVKAIGTPVEEKQQQNLPTDIESEEYEPIPEPPEEVKKHIRPTVLASQDVKPDFIDPSIYDEDDDSYVVGDEKWDMETRTDDYRKPEKKNFFMKLFGK